MYTYRLSPTRGRGGIVPPVLLSSQNLRSTLFFIFFFSLFSLSLLSISPFFLFFFSPPLLPTSSSQFGLKRLSLEFLSVSGCTFITDLTGSIIISRLLWRRSLGFVGVRALRATLLLMVAVMMVMVMMMVLMVVLGVHQRVGLRLILMAHQKVERASRKSGLVVSRRRKRGCHGRLAW